MGNSLQFTATNSKSCTLKMNFHVHSIWEIPKPQISCSIAFLQSIFPCFPTPGITHEPTVGADGETAYKATYQQRVEAFKPRVVAHSREQKLDLISPWTWDLFRLRVGRFNAGVVAIGWYIISISIVHEDIVLSVTNCKFIYHQSIVQMRSCSDAIRTKMVDIRLPLPNQGKGGGRPGIIFSNFQK